jgi:6-phospho-beta-glucosidase
LARIKMAYLGGGSTRAVGTMASFIHNGDDFDGSEVVLIDLPGSRLELVKDLADTMTRVRGLDLEITISTDRRAGLTDVDAVLSSFRPGGFQARVLDERIPLAHGVVGQETQGPGGFFMCLRAVHVMRGVAEDLAAVAPNARVFNYTNPVNLVAQAWTTHCEIPFVALCEGPIVYPRELLRDLGYAYDLVDARMVGLNHASWAYEQTYDGADALPILHREWEARRDDPSQDSELLRRLRIAVQFDAIPSHYFQYYYCEDEVLAELRAKPTTRAEDILSWTPGYWEHYEEQSRTDDPQLDPARSRGGIHELELAIDVMDAVYNDKGEVHPVNVPNAGRVLPGFDEDLVVEIYGRCGADWIEPLPAPAIPRDRRGLVEALAEYQALTGAVAWDGDWRDGVRALAANPLVRTLDKAETIYAELAAAHRAHLPERLLPPGVG